MTARKKRRELLRLGKRGDLIRIVADRRAGRVIAYYRDAAGLKHKQSWPDTPEGRTEALAWGEGFFEERKRMAEEAARAGAAGPAPITLGELWQRYAALEFEHLRAATRRTYTWQWARFMRFFGPERLAVSLTKADLVEFRVGTRQAGIVSNQIRQMLGTARLVLNWGIEHELLAHHALVGFRWKQHRDEQPLAPAEYTAEEFERLLAALSPQHPKQWRAWVFLMLAGHHGQRANAVQHLRWADVDLDAGVLTWAREYQKQGKALERPITWPIRSALLTARHWRETVRQGPVLARRKVAARPERLDAADWVLFAEGDKARPVSYTSMHYQLRQAETRAGVPHRPFRGFHGLRRMVVGETIAATGDRMAGLEVVGDTDPKQLKSYDRRQQERVQAALQALDERQAATTALPKVSPKFPEMTNAPEGALEVED